MRAVKSRVLLFAVLLFTADPFSAQPRASFSGTWLATSGPQQLVITQDATQLTVTDARGRLWAYRLDGSESRNETTSVTGEKWTPVSQAKWVSSALVITTTTTRAAGQQWDWMTIYTRDGDGNLQVTTLDAVTDPGPFLAMNLTNVTYKPKPGPHIRE